MTFVALMANWFLTLTFKINTGVFFTYLWHSLIDFSLLIVLTFQKKIYLFIVYFFWILLMPLTTKVPNLSEHGINIIHIFSATLLVKQLLIFIGFSKNKNFYLFLILSYLIFGGGLWNSSQNINLSFWVWDMIEGVSLSLFFIITLFYHNWSLVFNLTKGLDLWYLLPSFLNKISFFFTEHHLQSQSKTIKNINQVFFLTYYKKFNIMFFFISYVLSASFLKANISYPKVLTKVKCLGFSLTTQTPKYRFWLFYWHYFFFTFIFLIGSGFILIFNPLSPYFRVFWCF